MENWSEFIFLNRITHMSEYFAFGISLIVLVLIIFTEQAYNEEMFDESLDLIPKIQEDASTFKIGMWQFYTNVVFYTVLGGSIVTFVLIFG